MTPESPDEVENFLLKAEHWHPDKGRYSALVEPADAVGMHQFFVQGAAYVQFAQINERTNNQAKETADDLA